MLQIGLTGGIGSGKSTVAEIFTVLGIPVFDADTQAKFIMETNEALASSIKHAFGAESFVKGKLNRSYLANAVFNDAEKLKQLNALVHPVTILEAKKWMQKQKAPYVIKEAALLFEAGSAANLNYVIGVSSPEETRIKRVMERDKASREQVLSRINRQMDEIEKMKLCDFVIKNNEEELLIPQVLQLHNKFLSMPT